ncbi:hypothetical protein [Pseudophaeobacter leonis]|uniref:hypothetical protein n=1 Tax=Pseudophaeobacter leonis TaxID=1144477 RepID=UPI0030C6B016
MQPHAAMHPDRKQQGGLPPDDRRVPHQHDDIGVVVIHGEILMGNGGVGDMGQQLQRDQQAQQGLKGLGQRHPQAAPLCQLPEGQTGMHQKGSYQDHGPQRVAGDHLPSSLHGLHRLGGHKAKSKIEEVEKGVGE